MLRIVEGSDTQGLLDLLARRPASIELDRAALEIARIEFPQLDADDAIARIDRHAWAIAERARDLSDGCSFIETANAYLFREAGFRGNNDDYYRPDNSCLNRVLETRLGIPISLSVVYIEVARRLAKPVHGVGLPGHFLIRYDDSDYSAIIDPFHGGAILNEEQCAKLARVDTLDPALLEPVDMRYIAMRMINNLRSVYFARRDHGKALAILDLLIAADPDSGDEHKQRAVALLHQHRISEAINEFKRFLDLCPQAPDRERVEEQIRNLAFWRASCN